MLKKRLKDYQEEICRVKLYRTAKEGIAPWIISEPFQLSRHQLEEIEQIGAEVHEFLARCWRMSRAGRIKREFYESLSEDEKRGVERLTGRNIFPILVRPDMVIDEKGEFRITEIELCPGGSGMVQRLQEVYGMGPTMADHWADMITEEVVLSLPKWKAFVPEQEFFAERVKEKGGQMRFCEIEEWDKIDDHEGILFKNCCTISLLNEIYPPHIPPKATFCPPVGLDWKGWLALAHEDETLRKLRLSRRIPETYLLPLKKEKQKGKRKELVDLSTKEKRGWILKPVAGWGARGYKEGRDLNSTEWNKMVLGLSDTFSRGMILQEKVTSARYEKTGLSADGKLIDLKKLRIRVGPYYLFWKRKRRLAGIMITLRESDKVHGASDAIITIADTASLTGRPLAMRRL